MNPRNHDRVRSFLGAHIEFNQGRSTIDCKVRNISAAGAKLMLSETLTLPEEFNVVVPQKGRTFRARLRWRSDDGVGVEFLPDPRLEGGEAGDVLQTLRRLEAENRDLRKRVIELMAQLDMPASERSVA